MLKKIIKAIDENVFHVAMQNVLSLRLLGNKLHGDSLEFVLETLINRKTDYCAFHVGKNYFRKGMDFDIIISEKQDNLDNYLEYMDDMIIEKSPKANLVKAIADKYDLPYKNIKQAKLDINELLSKRIIKLDNVFPVSLKNYGKGPLQLFTNSTGDLIDAALDKVTDENEIEHLDLDLLDTDAFQKIKLKESYNISVIYDEKNMTYSVLFIDFKKLLSKVTNIVYSPRIQKKKSFTYKIVKFYDVDDYLFEVRYGKKDANALQRGLWTNINHINLELFDNLLINKPYNYDEEFLEKYKLMVSGL